MAGNLKDLKTRIKTAKNITQIAKAMEMISASKIRRAKQSVENNRPYTEKLIDILGKTLQGADLLFSDSPYVKNRYGGKKLVIAVSPDKGLCGSLVENIARHLSKLDCKECVLVTVGKKIERFAARHGYDVRAAFNMGSRLPKFEVIYPILEIVDKLYISGEVSEVHVLYSEFKNMMSNGPATKKLLPVSLDIENKNMPAQGYKYEPVAAELLNGLIPYYTEVRLYNCLINAFTTEQAARMLAMQNAKNNAIEITDFFTLSYNKLRQEKITNDILDITNAMLA
jgi:F-type H+-transporting ATPase subunit gamma